MTFVWLSSLTLLPLMIYIYVWLHRRISYFKNLRISQIPKDNLIFGNLLPLLLLRTSFGEFFEGIYKHCSDKDAKLIGFYIFATPALMVRDPQIIQMILIKNFNSFLNRYEAADQHGDAMGALTLPLAKYNHWRDSRRSIAELFTSGRIKRRMYPLMLQVANDLGQYLQRHEGEVLEVMHMCQLYTIDMTAKLFYSIDAGGLRNGTSTLYQQTHQLFKPSLQKVIHFMSVFFLPHWTRTIRAKVFAKEYARYMRKLVADIVADRRKVTVTVPSNAGGGGDLIDRLLHLQRNKPSHHYVQHPDFVPSQVGIILLAGFETSSALLGFTMYELAKQPSVQQRLRQELQDLPATLDYENLMTAPYLHMVAMEALRLYPAAAFINRECTAQDGFALQPHVDFVIPSGMPAYISILGVHRDPKYWPEPRHFNPDRFSPEKLTNIKPMTYMPFGAGPHGCVGSRLGLLQLKLGLTSLRSYRVEVCDRTVTEIRFKPTAFMLESRDEVYLRFFKE